MRRRVLVTGANGLIGRRVVKLLQGDSEPIAVVRASTPKACAVETITADLMDPNFAERLPSRADAVIHLAQSAGYTSFPENTNSMFAVNVAALAKLLDWSAKVGVKTFLLASTGGLYGRGPRPFKETDPVRIDGPLSFYFSTKRASEIIASPYRDLFDVTALRYFFSATSAEPEIIPRRTWSWIVSKARYGLTALAP